MALSPDDQAIKYEYARICETHGFIGEAARLFEKLSVGQTHSQFAVKAEQYDNLIRDTALQREWRNARFGTLVPIKNAEEQVMAHPSTCDRALAIWNSADPDGAADPKKLRQAAELYEQSTRTKPDDLHAYLDSATLYEILGDYDRAAALWEHAFTIRSDQFIYKMQANRLKSLAELDRNELTGMKKATLLRRIGNLFRGVNEPERALEYLRQSIDIDPQQAISWLDLAETTAEVGSYREAMNAADRALAIQPGLQGAEDVKKMLAGVLNRPEK